MSCNDGDNTKITIPRVPRQEDGHYAMFVEAAIVGYGKIQLRSPFVITGPLTEKLLIAKLGIRDTDVQRQDENGRLSYPCKDMKMWDKVNMKVTNFDEVNEFVKRDYRKGWSLGV